MNPTPAEYQRIRSRIERDRDKPDAIGMWLVGACVWGVPVYLWAAWMMLT